MDRQELIDSYHTELTDLLSKFKNGISHSGAGLKDVLRFQDIIGRQGTKEIRPYYEGLDQPGRKHFLWACFSCLSEDMATDIMVHTTLSLRMEHEYEELDKHFNEEQKRVDDRECTLALREQEIESKIKELENHIDKMARKLNTQYQEILRLRDVEKELSIRTNTFDTLINRYA